MVLADRVELTTQERAELQALVYSPDVAATVATRARIVLWCADNRQKKDIAALAGVSRPTVDLWLDRYQVHGIAGLLDRPRGAGREQVPVSVRARILALSRTSPPASTGLSHWSSREIARFIVSRGQAVRVEQGQHLGDLRVLRAHGGRIAEENRLRSPVSGSMRLSLTRDAVTSTAPALVSTSRGAW
jgi:transposase